MPVHVWCRDLQTSAPSSQKACASGGCLGQALLFVPNIVCIGSPIIAKAAPVRVGIQHMFDASALQQFQLLWWAALLLFVHCVLVRSCVLFHSSRAFLMSPLQQK